MKQRIGTFQDFKDYTLAIARGQRPADPSEPKVWSDAVAAKGGAEPEQLASHAAGISHYIHSTLREKIVEHVFVGEALRALWKCGATDVEVLRSEFDVGGYDLVMSYRGIVRHIQFKSSIDGGKAARVNVSVKLMGKPSGCVIWTVVSPNELELKSYRWLGARPGKRLSDNSKWKIAKHPKANAQGIKLEKPNHKVVPIGDFEKLDTMEAVLRKLFGRLP
jgi:hypothetical protein